MNRGISGFQPFERRHGRLADLADDPFPTTFSAWVDGSLVLPAGATHFGFVYEGCPTLHSTSGTFTLAPGMYCSMYGACEIGGPGSGVVMSRLDYRGVFQIGGPIEEGGRLRYIDGCTDSLLIPPVIKGDACLNLLHIPPGTDQTRHTHPSVRVGLIARGHGLCRTPEMDFPLAPGLAFVIPAGQMHSFYTEDSALSVIAYHPDSDCGATHEDHPMLNRTMADGLPASLWPQRGNAPLPTAR